MQLLVENDLKRLFLIYTLKTRKIARCSSMNENISDIFLLSIFCTFPKPDNICVL